MDCYTLEYSSPWINIRRVVVNVVVIVVEDIALIIDFKMNKSLKSHSQEDFLNLYSEEESYYTSTLPTYISNNNLTKWYTLSQVCELFSTLLFIHIQ